MAQTTTWWQSQPVYPRSDQLPFTTIGSIPLPVVSTEYTVYQYSPDYLSAVLAFINDNYIEGYQYSEDYFRRKLSIPESMGLILMTKHDQTIVGFIYCQPLIFQNKRVGYVDLMTVAKNKRQRGLAKILISHIVYFAGFTHYLHKKDSSPLPFPYFFRDRYYSIPTAILKYRYSVFHSNRIDPTGESVRHILLKSGDTISVVLHRFSYGILRNVLLGEVFMTTLRQFNLEDYKELISTLLALRVDFLVVLKSYPFFSEIIDRDNYIAGREVFLHSYNLYVPPQTENSPIHIPVF